MVEDPRPANHPFQTHQPSFCSNRGGSLRGSNVSLNAAAGNKAMSHLEILAWAAGVFGGALALFVAVQSARAFVPWLFVAGMLAFVAANICLGLTLTAFSAQEMVYWQNWRMVAESFLPGIWLLFSLSYARGNYREFVRTWRYPVFAIFALPVGLALGFSDQLVMLVGQDSQGGAFMFRLGLPGAVLNLVSLMSSVLIIMNLERTYRAAVGTMRWRIKFMVLGLGLMFVIQAYVSIQALLFHNTLDLSLQAVGSMALLSGGALVLRSLFRRGHFDADIYPPHSAFYASLTVLLAGIYLLCVGVFAKVAEFFGGDAAFTLKALVLLLILVLGAVLLVSDRVRLMVRRFASRYFQKPLYDYRSLWRRFTEETASCVRQTDLCQATVKLVADVFRALSVTIWLVDEKRENLIFAASTFLSQTSADKLTPPSVEAIEVLRALDNRPDPVDIDTAGEHWAEVLRRCHPDEFRHGGNRVCVPTIGGGRMLGLLVLGDRVGGMPFSWQDFDLLKRVADSVAAGLLNIQLSQKLLHTGQMEAFQTMSAFFVHDLKNTASTLNLMLKNLPEHFDDPAFREDALRGIAKTVAHINSLIERLGRLRSGLQVIPMASDLNELVLKALAGFEDTAGINLIKSLHPLPKILLDREQMLKVLINLVFNAREAVSTDGEVRIETSQDNGWAVLTVSDNGCGMDPDFLNRLLFRPFQTTKKNGLGIGLFQSKMIVEAHLGRINVESQPGKGTTFRIALPLPKPS
jgi:putative PEP-CTERM system histidine kinase